MAKQRNSTHKQKGFTLTEVMLVIALIGIASAISYPSISSYINKYNFRAASREVLTTTMQSRSNAVRDNDSWRVEFDHPNNSFNLLNPAGDVRVTHSLASYGNGIRLITDNSSCGAATLNWDSNSIAQANFISFNGRGFGNSRSIFLEDGNNDICYAVTATGNGVIRLRKYANSSWN